MALSISHFIRRILSPSNASLAQLSKEDSDLLNALTLSDSMDEPTAYAFIFLEVALSDGELDPREVSFIESALSKRFSLPRSRTSILVEKAHHLINSFRNMSSAINSIKAQFPEEERKELAQMISGLIDADLKKDPGEALLVEKLKRLVNA